VTPGQGCLSGGTQVPPAKPLNPNGIRISGSTSNTTAEGQYCWRVEYTGDANYLPQNHTNAASECFTVVLQVTGCPTSNPLLGAGTECTVIESDAFKVSITGPAGQFQGDVCIGDGGSLDMSGDNFILGDVHFETTVACNGCTTGPTGRVRGADGQSGVVDVNAGLVSAAIDACDNAAVVNAAKTCTIGDYTQSLSALASATADANVRRLTGLAGENVVCVSEVTVTTGKTIELFGGATTSFVINVKSGGAFTINGGKIVAVAPVTPSDVLYNVLGTGGDVSFTGGGGGVGCCNASIDGTLIAIDRAIALAPGLINGQLCSNQKMDLVSGSAVRCPTQ